MSVRFNRVIRADARALGKQMGSRDPHGFSRKVVTICDESPRVDTFAARSCGLVMKEKNTKDHSGRRADFRAALSRDIIATIQKNRRAGITAMGVET